MKTLVKKTHVYIVEVATGEYEDYRTRPMRSFAGKPEADAFARKANDWCMTNRVHPDNIMRRGIAGPTREEADRRSKLMCPYDVAICLSHEDTGVRFFVTRVQCGTEEDGRNYPSDC